MKTIVLFLTMFLLMMTPVFAGSADNVEGPNKCEVCGMDRTVFAQSRMLITYADGTAVGICSLHCAAEKLQQNRKKKVSSLMVADYRTKKLVKARTAAWVVGGKKQGVMTAVPKWAFASEKGARSFMAENGGVLNSFDQAMKSATKEVMDEAAEEKAAERAVHH